MNKQGDEEYSFLLFVAGFTLSVCRHTIYVIYIGYRRCSVLLRVVVTLCSFFRFAIAAWSLPALSFAVYTCANLYPRAYRVGADEAWLVVIRLMIEYALRCV